jgi:hypothetical protein
MAIQLSVSARNNRQDSIETTVGTAPKLQLRTGAPPANCAAADSGTLICEITLPSDWAAAASAGAKAKSGTWQGTAVAAGVVAHFRLKDSAGTTCHMQGTVTDTGGGGDATIDNDDVNTGQVITVTSWTTTDANA